MATLICPADGPRRTPFGFALTNVHLAATRNRIRSNGPSHQSSRRPVWVWWSSRGEWVLCVGDWGIPA